jgi:hypothetical protein
VRLLRGGIDGVNYLGAIDVMDGRVRLEGGVFGLTIEFVSRDYGRDGVVVVVMVVVVTVVVRVVRVVRVFGVSKLGVVGVSMAGEVVLDGRDHRTRSAMTVRAVRVRVVRVMGEGEDRVLVMVARLGRVG